MGDQGKKGDHLPPPRRSRRGPAGDAREGASERLSPRRGQRLSARMAPIAWRADGRVVSGGPSDRPRDAARRTPARAPIRRARFPLYFPQASSAIFVSVYASLSVALTVPIGVLTLPGPVALMALAVSP